MLANGNAIIHSYENRASFAPLLCYPLSLGLMVCGGISHPLVRDPALPSGALPLRDPGAMVYLRLPVTARANLAADRPIDDRGSPFMALFAHPPDLPG